MVREVTIKINLYAQKRIPSIAINLIRTPRTQFVHIQLGSSRCQQIGKKRLQLDW